MALSSFTVKAAAGGTLATASGLTGIYLAKDLIIYYDIERKIINGEVELEVGNQDKTTDTSKTAWTIRTKEDHKPYSWECLISDGANSKIPEGDIKILFDQVTGNTYDIRKSLVQACAKNREVGSVKIKSTIDISNKGVTAENWISKLFEQEVLNVTEKKILDSKVYFTFQPSNDTDKFPLTITATAGDRETLLTEGNHSWKCVVSGGNAASVITTFKDKLPSTFSDDTKQLSKKKLVYACAKGRTTSFENVAVNAKLTILDPKEANKEHEYLFGKQ